ncbi:hypothetical protein HG531_011294 [Fusarium graminearum]|nr:hypothetical protein HG531_011294 [Fusarium graminearum]
MHARATCLDSIDGSVTQRTHSTRHKTAQGGLVVGQVSVLILRLGLLQPVLEVAVSSKVDSLVRTLPQSRQAHTAVQRTKTLFLNDGVERVSSVAVLGNIEGIRHGVVLRLKTDLDDLHGCHDADGFRNTGSQTSNKDTLAGHGARLVGEELLVLFKRGEADGHLGDNSRKDSAETLVQAEGRLFCDDGGAGFQEAALRGSWLTSAS